ncbi:MAG: class I SAM-dependent methyltransferase [Acidobacteriia bacterium]|nr:class I SAM-dependent methyltransferase [Terriglobia bacterium]
MSSVQKLVGRALRKAARIIDPPETIRLINDEYISWLGYANAGMLERGNLHSIDYAIGHLPSAAPILEIGSFCGLSTNVITHLKRKHGAKNPLITCDKWEFENVDGRSKIPNSPVLFSDYRAFVRDSYIRNIQMFSGDDLPFTFEMTADVFFAAWKDQKDCADILGRNFRLGGQFSFCYIDGNHTYEYAKRDFLNSDAYLETGGFIFFDDSTLGEFSLHKLMPEIMTSGRYHLVATNPYHLFQKTGPGS